MPLTELEKRIKKTQAELLNLIKAMREEDARILAKITEAER